ncbi:MAG: hypothetical protein ACRESU_02010 [Gammaproteobacteria bacterium]
MNDVVAPPPFLSLAFHVRFLPTLIRSRLKPQPLQSPFANHGMLEFSILLVISLVLLAVGIPGVAHHPPTWPGVVFTCLGVAGLMWMLVVLIGRWERAPVTYAGFEPLVFLFVILLGLTVGLFLAHDVWQSSLSITWALAAGGLVGGYVLGIGAGLWCQLLGPLKGLFTYLAGIASFGLIVLDILLAS